MPSSSTTNRRTRRQRLGEPPAEVAARSESPTSAISALTNSNSAQRLRDRNEDRNNLTLFQLSNVASPVLPARARAYNQDALDEEQAYDKAAYEENAGAGDSDEEDPQEESVDENPDKVEQVKLEALFEAEAKAAAELPPEYVESGTADHPNGVWCYGSPPGWTPPGPPDGWAPTKARGGEPENFKDINNPGGWSSFSYQPKPEVKGGKYFALR